MATLAVFFLAGFALLLGAIVFQTRRERGRSRQMLALELEPNCLLTRHPLVFLAGKRNLFKINDHWNLIPRFLREHGYEVLVLEPPSRTRTEASLLKALDDLPEACHLIADTSLEYVLETFSRLNHPRIATLTLIRQFSAGLGPRTTKPADPASLRPPSHAIETFEVRTAKNGIGGWSDHFARALLAARNSLAAVRGERPVNPWEVGELTGAAPWQIERQFLRLAVSLAERDLKRCEFFGISAIQAPAEV